MGTCKSKVVSYVEDMIDDFQSPKKKGPRKGLSAYDGEDVDDSEGYGGGLLANDEGGGGGRSFDYGNLMDDIEEDDKKQ